MRSIIRSLTALALILASGVAIRAQESTPKDRPRIHVPLHAETKQELDHREALKLYGKAVLHERSNRLLEAVRVFEQARQLEPEATPIHRALCPLYLALDRTEDALAACRKVVELEPGDYDTWYVLARQYRASNRNKDAQAALARATACTGLNERPELRAQMWFDRGVLHENAQEYAGAEKAFREVVAVLDNPRALAEGGTFSRVEINAQAAETYERLGRVCLKAGRHDAAIEAFRAAQAKDARRAARLSYNLAEVYEARGNPVEALRSLDVYLQTQPQGTEAYQKRIALLETLGRSVEALPSLQKAADADKYNVGLKLLLATQYAKRNEREKAKAIYDGLLLTTPSAEVYRGLMALYEPANPEDMNKLLALLDSTLKKAIGDGDKKPGSPAQAAEARFVLQVLRDEPKLVGGLLSVAPDHLRGSESLDGQTRYYLAVLAARVQKLNEAELLFRSCLGASGRPDRHEQEAYHGLLQVLQMRRKHAEIIQVCQQGLLSARLTNRVLFEDGLAHAYLALDKLDQAVEAATQAAEHSGEESRCYCRRVRAHVLAQARRFDEAVQECQGMLKEYRQAKDVREIRIVLSVVYSEAKKLAEAEEQLRLLLERDPDDALVNNNLGYQLADEGKNLDEAEKLIRKALALDRDERTKGKTVGPDSDHDNAAYLDSLGWVLFRQGKFAEARKELEKALVLSDGKDDPVVWDHLGDACARLNDRVQARAKWQKAVELYEQGYRRKAEDRYKEINQKLKLLK